MGAKYTAFNSQTNTASTTIAMNNLMGGTTKRVRLYHLIIGSVAAPANQAAHFAVKRTSARGTQSSTFTPTKLDPADAAAAAVFDTSWSADPTITASSELLIAAMNQQATFQWMVDPSNGLVIPATAAAGLAILSVATTSAVAYLFNEFFEE